MCVTTLDEQVGHTHREGGCTPLRERLFLTSVSPISFTSFFFPELGDIFILDGQGFLEL